MKIWILRGFGLVAAAFVVMDAGRYYQTFYTSTEYANYFPGFVLATVLEVFLIITISTKITISKDSKWYTHIKRFFLNGIINLLTLLLFIQVVAVSAVITALPSLEGITRSDKSKQLVSVLQTSLDRGAKDTEYMRDHKQTLNLMMAVKSQRDHAEKLIKDLSITTATELEFWVQLVVSISVKLSLQLLNLWLFWFAGYRLRNPRKIEVDTVAQEQPSFSEYLLNKSKKNTVNTPSQDHVSKKDIVVTSGFNPNIHNMKIAVKELGITAQEIAKELSISRSSVYMILNHAHAVFDYIQKINGIKKELKP